MYDSSAKKIDLSWLKEKEKKSSKGKKNHEYNSYKFKDANKGKGGKFSGGVLKFSNNEIKRVKNQR